ncbi:MAG: hypothetical protein ACAH80_09500 [Alphaproteobacteria bacterium]
MANETDIKRRFKAVATYDTAERVETLQLAPAGNVIAALDFYRQDLFLTGIDKAIGTQATDLPKGALDILTGRHVNGFKITIVQAEHNDKPVFLPVVEDSLLQEVLVVAPGPRPDSCGPAVVYVDSTDTDASAQVNDFLIRGARLRGERSLLDPEGARNLIDDMITAVSMVGDLPETRAMENNITIGAAFAEVARGNSGMVNYVMACNLIDYKAEATEGTQKPIAVRGPLSFKGRVV